MSNGGENLKQEKRYWLINKRLERNLDQQDVAELIGTTQQFYNYVENGKRRPCPEIAIKIGKVLDLEWTKFYEKKNKKNQEQEKEE